MEAEVILAGDRGDTTADSAPDPLIGKLLAGKYRLQALIAKGGMGRIFRAEQQPLGRPVAIKLLAMDSASAHDPTFVQRFSLEAATLGRLRHPNTVTLFDYGVLPEEDACYIAMELVEGETLSKLVKREGALEPGRAVRFAYEVARALVEAHALGIVHRDLKPANLMLTQTDEGERIKILDFGIAKVQASADQELTAVHTVMGSPRFMSPEQVRNERVDARSDLYSLGVVLFFLLTGREPFRGRTPVETMMAHLNQEVPSIASCGVIVPPGVEAVVRRCLEKRPEDRYQSAEELKLALRAALGSLDQVVTGATQTLSHDEVPATPAPTDRPPDRRVAALAVLVALVAMLAVVGMALAPLWTRGPAPAVEPVPAAVVEPPPAPAPAPVPAVVAPVHLTVTSEPPNAEVREGGSVVGHTPLVVDAAPGGPPRVLELRLGGYVPATVSWTPTSDETRNVALKAAPVRPPPPKPRPKGDDLLLER